MFAPLGALGMSDGQILHLATLRNGNSALTAKPHGNGGREGRENVSFFLKISGDRKMYLMRLCVVFLLPDASQRRKKENSYRNPERHLKHGFLKSATIKNPNTFDLAAS